MASKLNLDTSTKLDITCRSGDDFEFTATFSNNDSSHIDFTSIFSGELVVLNPNLPSFGTVRKLYTLNYNLDFNGIDIYESITIESDGQSTVKFEAPGDKMIIPKGSYTYTFKVMTNLGKTYTFLHGKFKVI